MTKEERKSYKRIGDLFRKSVDSGSSDGEREQARKKLEQLLQKIGKKWSDLAELLRLEAQAELEEKQARAAAQGATYDPQTGAAVKPKDIPCIDLVDHILRQYLDLTDHEFTAVTLWVLHTHIFERFMITPRLTFMSPVPDCGKSTAMKVLARLVARPDKSDSTTPAAVYWELERGKCTFLLDEMDNADLMNNGEMRRVINSGHDSSGTVKRFIGGRSKRFSTFAPMALAAINKDRPLPWPILSRSIIVNMQRSRRPLRRFDNGDVSDLDAIRGQVWLWARPDLELNLDPEMPAGLRTRPRDNWAVLVAIADTFGPSRGQAARDAAVAFASTRRAVDLGILLLEDTREIFAALGVDRLLSKELVEHLRDMPDAGWDELPLTPTRLAKMLGAFNNATINLTPRSIWPKERTRRSKSGKGYLREQFESA